MDNMMDTAFSKLRKEAEEFLQSKSAIAGNDGLESLRLIKELLAS